MSWCIRGIIFKERGQEEGEWKERKFNDKKGIEALLLARKRGTMMTIAGNCTQRRDQSGSKKGKGGK